MKRLCLVVLVAYMSNFVRCDTATETIINEAFVLNQIVPDVVSESPTGYLTVQFSSGVASNLGNELTPTQMKDIPTLSWDASSDLFYTVMLTDPDAPSRGAPTSREWLHWMVGNVPGNDVSSGDTIAEYVGAGPSEGSGLHRYVFLVYTQTSHLEFNELRLKNTSADNRTQFSVINFATKYNLGSPLAGNFNQAGYDDYVPILYEQLGL